MSGRELGRVPILARVKAGTLSVKSAAVLLHVGSRHAKRLARRYRARGARSSYHKWKLPSSWTNSPKCPLRSRRCRCGDRFRYRLHSPAASIQRRNVS